MEKSKESSLSALETLRAPLPDDLFNEPIEYIFADHFRQRALCALLDEIASGTSPDIQMVMAVLGYLKSEFQPHLLDEEKGLFPMLSRRAKPEDEIDEVLRQLTEEHASDGEDAKDIILVLEQIAKAGGSNALSEKAADLLKRFAANERQHLIVENSIVLPLARARLTEEDCRDFGQRMAARRGVVLND